MVKRAGEEGYIAVISVIIVGAVALAITLTLLANGTDSERSGTIEQQSMQARSLASACAEEALQQMHDATYYVGTGSLTLATGTCTYTVTSTGTSTRTVTAVGTAQNAIKKLQIYATINTTSISITGWQETR